MRWQALLNTPQCCKCKDTNANLQKPERMEEVLSDLCCDARQALYFQEISASVPLLPGVAFQRSEADCPSRTYLSGRSADRTNINTIASKHCGGRASSSLEMSQTKAKQRRVSYSGSACASRQKVKGRTRGSGGK